MSFSSPQFLIFFLIVTMLFLALPESGAAKEVIEENLGRGSRENAKPKKFEKSSVTPLKLFIL